MNVINNLRINLKFTLELESNNSLYVLDVTIFKDNENLSTKWFRKSIIYRYFNISAMEFNRSL